MKRIKVIRKDMSPKTKARIKGILTCVCILIIVALFVALVVGLSLGLRDDDDDCPSGQHSCKGKCRDYNTDPDHCGGCGKSCPEGADCVDGGCAFCVTNCTLDNDMCTIDPCNSTTGCTILDCDNDADQCSIGPCDPLTGCGQLNCTTDDDVCTIGPCDPETGCALVDCNSDADPCTAEPCDPVRGCANICPILTLNPPSVNFTATYADFNTARRIVGTGAKIASLTNILSVTITISPSGSGGTFAYTAQGGITDSGLSGDTFTLTGSGSPAQYQSVLRTLTYQNPSFSASTATFTFSVTNQSTTSPDSQNPVSTINV